MYVGNNVEICLYDRNIVNNIRKGCAVHPVPSYAKHLLLTVIYRQKVLIEIAIAFIFITFCYVVVYMMLHYKFVISQSQLELFCSRNYKFPVTNLVVKVNYLLLILIAAMFSQKLELLGRCFCKFLHCKQKRMFCLDDSKHQNISYLVMHVLYMQRNLLTSYRVLPHPKSKCAYVSQSQSLTRTLVNVIHSAAAQPTFFILSLDRIWQLGYFS